MLVVGERDQKEGGQWPGRDGAKSVAAHLGAEWDESVQWTLPPEGIKDVRAWLEAKAAAGLNLVDAELLTVLTAAAREAKAKRERSPSDAELIVRLAEERFRLGRTDRGDLFAVRVDGPNVAVMLRGSAEALRASLATEFRAAHGRTASASTLTDAMVTLQGAAQNADPEPVALRVAEHDGGIVLDLGGADGRAVVRSGRPVIRNRPTARATALRNPRRMDLGRAIPGGRAIRAVRCANCRVLRLATIPMWR